MICIILPLNVIYRQLHSVIAQSFRCATRFSQ